MDEKSFNAVDYHKATCHDRFHMAGYSLDWASQPDVVKRYPEAERIPLIPVKHLDTSSLWDLCDPEMEIKPSAEPDLESLSTILAMGSGVTFQRRHGQSVYSFRSAASAGALYPVDLYVDACRVTGLEPGLYHDHIVDFTLERLKKKETDATASDLLPWAVIYVTGVFVRSSWKYRGRAYRYILNAAGHVIANILLSARSLGFSTRLDYDFNDGLVNAFLGLDQTREACLSRICLFTDSETEVSPYLFYPFVDLVMKGFGLMERASRVYGSLKLGFLVRDVDGFDDGHYVSDSYKHSIGCLDAGDKAGVMASACLDQRWLVHASVHFVMTGDVEDVERELGARAYRYMMMNAGFLGQIIYLGAISLGLGCCGIGAFYDHEASMVLDTDKDSLLYMVAAGHVKGSF